MTAGTLIGWLKNVGAAVKRGDIIAEVDLLKPLELRLDPRF